MNERWHVRHPMPKNPTLDERIRWHEAHAKACGCRPIPERVRTAIEARRRGDREAAT